MKKSHLESQRKRICYSFVGCCYEVRLREKRQEYGEYSLREGKMMDENWEEKRC